MGDFAQFSLPSISSLLGIADNGPSQQQEQATPRQSLSLTTTQPGSVPRRSPSSFIYFVSQHGCVPISSGLHMPEMRQSVLPTFEFKNPQTQPYGGETIMLPGQRLWEKVQCVE